jgi:probable addiction module antidote protein
MQAAREDATATIPRSSRGRSKGGMLQLERLTGIKRQTLNKSLGPDGNPTLETLVPVLKALGIRLRVEHVSAQERELADA